MARYPELPRIFFSMAAGSEEDKRKELYALIQQWGAALLSELELRDVEVDSSPSTNVYSVLTVSEIGRPKAGDIVYAASAGKFKGYVSIATTAAWYDLGGP